MTQFRGQHGKEDFPWQPKEDNHYAIGNNGKDVLQCRVEVTRTSGDSYQATVYDTFDTKQGQASKQLTDNDMKLEVPGKGGLMSTFIQRTDQMGKAGTRGSKVFFYYGDSVKDILHAPKSSIWTDFEWFSDSYGNDNAYKKKDKTDDVRDGGYCKVPNIEENENGDIQTITCYFPCEAL